MDSKENSIFTSVRQAFIDYCIDNPNLKEIKDPTRLRSYEISPLFRYCEMYISAFALKNSGRIITKDKFFDEAVEALDFELPEIVRLLLKALVEHMLVSEPAVLSFYDFKIIEKRNHGDIGIGAVIARSLRDLMDDDEKSEDTNS